MSFEGILNAYFKYTSYYNSASFRYLQFVMSTLLSQKHTYNIFINFTFILFSIASYSLYACKTLYLLLWELYILHDIPKYF